MIPEKPAVLLIMRAASPTAHCSPRWLSPRRRAVAPFWSSEVATRTRQIRFAPMSVHRQLGHTCPIMGWTGCFSPWGDSLQGLHHSTPEKHLRARPACRRWEREYIGSMAISSPDLKAFLIATPFFVGLSDASLDLLVSMLVERRFDVGATVVGGQLRRFRFGRWGAGICGLWRGRQNPPLATIIDPLVVRGTYISTMASARPLNYLWDFVMTPKRLMIP
jgi:hypothetical protein